MGGESNVEHWTVYGVGLEGLGRTPTTARRTMRESLLGGCDFWADDPLTFEECLFASDCEWYTPEGQRLAATGPDRLEGLNREMDRYGIAEDARPRFINCVFSELTSAELMNNPEVGDLTLVAGTEALRADGRYYGALPPALNVAIMEDSTGVAGTWDERSANGLLRVRGSAIVIDEGSSDSAGEIVSKVVRIDTSRMSVTAILSKFATKWSTHNVHMSGGRVLGATYVPGAILPAGRYMASGDVVYRNTSYPNGSTVVVTDEGTTFLNDAVGSADATLREIEDPNITDVCYIRSTLAIYALIQASDGLQRGGVYLNYGGDSIRYRGRIIGPGESFVAVNGSDTFTPPDGNASYQIGVMFDDTRVPSQEWIPAQFFGEYFVYKENGVIQLDNDGTPISSGNYLAYQPQQQGGYSDVLRKSTMVERYCQFKLIASKS